MAAPHLDGVEIESKPPGLDPPLYVKEKAHQLEGSLLRAGTRSDGEDHTANVFSQMASYCGKNLLSIAPDVSMCSAVLTSGQASDDSWQSRGAISPVMTHLPKPIRTRLNRLQLAGPGGGAGMMVVGRQVYT